MIKILKSVKSEKKKINFVSMKTSIKIVKLFYKIENNFE